MRISGLVVALAALAGLAVAGVGCAQQGVPLAFKFATGDVLQYDVTLSGAGGMSAGEGSLTPVSLQGSFSVVQRVTRVLADGSAQLETRIPRGEITLVFDRETARFSYGDGKLRWYANGKESSPPQGDLSKVLLLGAPLTYTMAPDGLVRDMVLPAPQVLGGMAKSLPALDPSAIQGMGEAVFPSAPVRVGETWRKTAQLAPLGPGFPLSATVSRTLASFDDRGGIGLAKITGFAEVRLRGAGSPVFSAQDVSISVPEIKQTITSTEFFNATVGRLLRGDYDLAFSARISAKAGGQEKGGALEARLRVSVQAR